MINFLKNTKKKNSLSTSEKSSTSVKIEILRLIFWNWSFNPFQYDVVPWKIILRGFSENREKNAKSKISQRFEKRKILIQIKILN